MKNIRYYPTFLPLLLSFFLLQGFTSQPENTITLKINPKFGTQNLVLESGKYVTTNGDTVSVNRLRFYMSAIQFTFSDGSVYKESNSYHLIDAEDAATLGFGLKDVPKKDITAITFNIGVDSLASVSGALEGDLDPVKGMYWAWNSGYINAKLEGKCRVAENEEYEFHVGGYLPPYAAIRKVNLKIDAQNTGNTLALTADVQAWFHAIQLSKTNRIVMPGEQAMKMADNYIQMFRID
ncbi:MAG TPA: MbnP family protein [Bacteroidia bacterium]